MNGADVNIWGNTPADTCTSILFECSQNYIFPANQFYGCERSSNGVNIINPAKSARYPLFATYMNFAAQHRHCAELHLPLRALRDPSQAGSYIPLRVHPFVLVQPRGDWMWPVK